MAGQLINDNLYDVGWSNNQNGQPVHGGFLANAPTNDWYKAAQYNNFLNAPGQVMGAVNGTMNDLQQQNAQRQHEYEMQNRYLAAQKAIAHEPTLAAGINAGAQTHGYDTQLQGSNYASDNTLAGVRDTNQATQNVASTRANSLAALIGQYAGGFGQNNQNPNSYKPQPYLINPQATKTTLPSLLGSHAGQQSS